MLESFAELKAHHRVLFAVIIAFAMISFWRGTWGLMDTYLFPGNPVLSYGTSAATGLIILALTGYITRAWGVKTIPPKGA